MKAPFPWQIGPWQRLQDAKAADRMPHGLLVMGPSGTGKALFAQAVAKMLLCRAPDAPCGRCGSCRQFTAGAHSDFSFCGPEEPDKPIKIDQIRELIARVNLTSSRGHYKVVIISPADAMTLAAANGLLLTLEEPPPRTVIILVSHVTAHLPPTVRSRCQKIHFPADVCETAVDWLVAQGLERAQAARVLAISGGRPLHASTLADSGGLSRRDTVANDLVALAEGRAEPIATAGAWVARGLGDSLMWLQTIVHDALMLGLGQDESRLRHRDRADLVRRLSTGMDLRLLFLVSDRLQRARASVTAHQNLNLQSLAEAVAVGCYRGAGRTV